jgi:hypothetical protein
MKMKAKKIISLLVMTAMLVSLVTLPLPAAASGTTDFKQALGATTTPNWNENLKGWEDAHQISNIQDAKYLVLELEGTSGDANLWGLDIVIDEHGPGWFQTGLISGAVNNFDYTGTTTFVIDFRTLGDGYDHMSTAGGYHIWISSSHPFIQAANIKGAWITNMDLDETDRVDLQNGAWYSKTDVWDTSGDDPGGDLKVEIGKISANSTTFGGNGWYITDDVQGATHLVIEIDGNYTDSVGQWGLNIQLRCSTENSNVETQISAPANYNHLSSKTYYVFDLTELNGYGDAFGKSNTFVALFFWNHQYIRYENVTTAWLTNMTLNDDGMVVLESPYAWYTHGDIWDDGNDDPGGTLKIRLGPMQSIPMDGWTALGWHDVHEIDPDYGEATKLVLEVNGIPAVSPDGMWEGIRIELESNGPNGWSKPFTVLITAWVNESSVGFASTTYFVIDLTSLNGWSDVQANTLFNLEFWNHNYINVDNVSNAWLTNIALVETGKVSLPQYQHMWHSKIDVFPPDPDPAVAAAESPPNLQFNIANDASETEIGSVKATGGGITYSIETPPGTGNGDASIDAKTGAISFTPSSTVQHVMFTVKASNDLGDSYTRVVVTVTDPPRSNTIYAAPNGSGAGQGATEQTAVTPQRAHNISRPGDTILFLDGEYTTTDGWALLNITRSGLPGHPITYKAQNRGMATIKTSDSWNGIFIQSASHIIIDGLKVTNDDVDSVLAEAVYDAAVGGTPHPEERKTNTNGISGGPHPDFRVYNGGDAAQVAGAVFPHHITVRNCEVFNMPAGGITFVQTDWLTVENNFVHGNCNWDIYASSGINIYQAYDIDDNTTDYKFKFLNNISINNEHLIKWAYRPGSLDFSDGNGIIIDDNKKTQNNHISQAYRGKTLIANNLVYGNGGSGIHSFQSENIDIINNTSYLNNMTTAKGLTTQMAWGEIFAQNSSNVNIFNNIAQVQPSTRGNMNLGNSNVVYGSNIYFSGATAVTRTHPMGNGNAGPGDIVGGAAANPLFNDPANGDFTLQAGSPGLTGANSTWASNVGNSTGQRGVFRHVGITGMPYPPVGGGGDPGGNACGCDYPACGDDCDGSLCDTGCDCDCCDDGGDDPGDTFKQHLGPAVAASWSPNPVGWSGAHEIPNIRNAKYLVFEVSGTSTDMNLWDFRIIVDGSGWAEVKAFDVINNFDYTGTTTFIIDLTMMGAVYDALQNYSTFNLFISGGHPYITESNIKNAWVTDMSLNTSGFTAGIPGTSWYTKGDVWPDDGGGDPGDTLKGLLGAFGTVYGDGWSTTGWHDIQEDVDDFQSATHLVIEVSGTPSDSGGLWEQTVVLNHNGDGWGWNDTKVITAWFAGFDFTGTTTFVIDLTKLNGYDTFITSTAGNILVFDHNYINATHIQNAWLTNMVLNETGKVVMPAYSNMWHSKGDVWPDDGGGDDPGNGNGNGNGNDTGGGDHTNGGGIPGGGTADEDPEQSDELPIISGEASEDGSSAEAMTTLEELLGFAEGDGGVLVDMEILTIEFDEDAIEAIADAMKEQGLDGDITITVALMDNEDLPEELKEQAGDRPVYEFNMWVGDEKISFHGGNVVITIPYTINAKGENPNAIFINYFNPATGVLELVRGYYQDGAVVFTVSHFSQYIINYRAVWFNDIPDDFRAEIMFLAATGVTMGIGGGRFGSYDDLTREQFLILLMRAYNLGPDTEWDDNFTDAGEINWYSGWLAAAKRLNISEGMGDGRFGAGEKLTYAQALTFLRNILKVFGEDVKASANGKALSEFTDAEMIPDWVDSGAVESLTEAGIYTEEKINWDDNMSRAMAARLMYNLLRR